MGTVACRVAERLDVLFHAHDIQGLGHVSRGIAILGTLARLRPGSRLCLVTGSRSLDTTGAGGIDWVKLPSYGASVAGGVMRPARGPSGLTLAATRRLRARLLADLVEATRPRVVLVDHRPKGQHDELLPILAGASRGTHWILGMRAVVGAVEGVWTEEARQVYRRHYSDLFWYGDRSVVGDGPVDELAAHFGTPPVELGYVSRAQFLAESGLIHRGGWPRADSGVFAATWLSRESLRILESFLDAVRSGGTGVTTWNVFVGEGEEGGERARLLRDLEATRGVVLRPVSDASVYLRLLSQARAAVVHAGYNSLLDSIWAGTPTIAVARRSANREQSTHATLVAARVRGIDVLAEDEVREETLAAALGAVEPQPLSSDGFPATGATRTAAALAAVLDG